MTDAAKLDRYERALQLIVSHDRALIIGDAYNFRAIAWRALNQNAPRGICEQENACEQDEGA